MTEVISVHFKNKGKVYFFDPSGFTVAPGDFVIVETAKGLEYAECVKGNHEVEDTTVIPPLRPVIRMATKEDTKKANENKKKEAEAFEICKEKIIKHDLDMKLVDVEYNFEGNKILFFFTSDGRVDFRDLVKDLASVFKTRIELRQIGVRDEARMLGGLGICGRPFCCAQFLDDFQPVSIKMAKTQGLSLNPTKISGTCGRLMCCLKYEQEAYEDLVKNVPKVDSFVQTPDGKGAVTDVNLLRGSVRVKIDDHNDMTVKTFDAKDVEVLGGKAMRTEYLATLAEERAAKEAQRIQVREARLESARNARAASKAAARHTEQTAEEEKTNTSAHAEDIPVSEPASSAPSHDGTPSSHDSKHHRQHGTAEHNRQHSAACHKSEHNPEHKAEHNTEQENTQKHEEKSGSHRRKRRPQRGKKPQNATPETAGTENAAPQTAKKPSQNAPAPKPAEPAEAQKKSGKKPNYRRRYYRGKKKPGSKPESGENKQQ